MVEFLNTAFAGFDGAVLRAMHGLAESTGGLFTPFFKIITLLGEKGLIFILASIVLMMFVRTRKLGVCMFGAIACGALLTNVILKDIIARPRPFEGSLEFRGFWEFIGSPAEDGYSFPSGHTTAIAGAMTAMFIFCNKKWSWVGFIGVMLMGLSRNYLMAHYPTDVIAGIIVGAVSAIASYYITKYIFVLFEKHKEKKFCDFCLNFDFGKIIKKEK